MPAALHVAGEAGPDEGDDGAVAVGRVDAGAADLDEVVPDRFETGEVELALGVEASGDAGAFGRQQPVRRDDLAALRLPDQEVVAVRVEGVAVQARFGAVQPGAELGGEDLVAQALGGAYLRLVNGEADTVARRGGGGGPLHRDGRSEGGGGGQRRHGGLRGRVGRGGCRAFARSRGPGPSYFFRDRLDSTCPPWGADMCDG